MGAGVARVRVAAQECLGGNPGTLSQESLELFQPSDDQELVLRVVYAPIENSSGAHLTGFKVDAEAHLMVSHLTYISGLDTLGWRYREKNRQQWPMSYRFQAPKKSWHVKVVDSLGLEQVCILQIASSPDERLLENAMLDVDDSKVAATYAHRFNLQQMQAISGAAGPQAPQAPDAAAGPEALVSVAVQAISDLVIDDGSAPRVKVAAPVACEVLASGYPSMVPVGTYLTLTPYAEKDVQKFIFDGISDEFSELPQAYFHYAAFSSGGKEYVCDIQGVEDDNGCFLLVDPCVLRSNLPTVRDLVGVVANTHSEVQSISGPTVDRFDTLHPKCSQACKTFDPQRRSALRNGKVGMCGMGTCGMNFAKCGR